MKYKDIFVNEGGIFSNWVGGNSMRRVLVISVYGLYVKGSEARGSN